MSKAPTKGQERSGLKYTDIKPYFQDIICNRDTRASGNKRNTRTKYILFILIISIILIIIGSTLLVDGNHKWWVILLTVLGSVGGISGLVWHYYNTKTYIENSRYDIDIGDIEQFKNIKNNIKKNKQIILQNEKEISDLKKQINSIINKNKVKAFASSLASSTVKGIEKAKTGIASSTAKGIEKTNEWFSSLNKNKVSPTASAANEFYVGGEDDLSVPEDPLKKLKEKLAAVQNVLDSNKTLLDNQMKDYDRIKYLNDIYKKIKMANLNNNNIILNIGDFYKDSSLLEKNIIYVDVNELNSFNNSEYLNDLNKDEKDVYNKYNNIISDIYSIKLLKAANIPDKINEISQKEFKIEYLQNLKEINLNKYIKEFLDDIKDTLINNSDINKYFTIGNQFTRIYNSLVNFSQQKSFITTEYEELNKILIPKYTKIAIAEIENMKNKIKNEKYAIKISQSFVDKYDEYVNYNKLDTTFNSSYDKIIKDLRYDFIDYVVNSLKLPPYTLDDKNSIESIVNFKQSYQDDVENKNEVTRGKISDALNHPLLSTYPYNKKMLMDKILKPINDQITKLQKAEAEAKNKSTSNTSFFFS